MQLSVGRDPYQSVEPARSSRVKRLTDADADHLRSTPPTALRLFGLPIELPRALVQRVAQVRARDGTLIAAVARSVVRRVDASDRDLVQAELTRRFVDDRLDRSGDLVLARTALRTPRRRVGQHPDPAEAHRQRGIHDGDGAGCAREVAEPRVRAVLLHDVQVGHRDAAVAAEAELDTALEAGARGTEEVFFGAADTHHHGPAGLLGHMGGDRHDRVRAALRSESAPAELRHVYQVLRLDADVAGQSTDDLGLTLGRSEDVALAILPIRHGAAGFHGVVGMTGGHESLVEHQRRVCESRFEVTVRPLRRRLAHRQGAVLRRREVLLGPFDFLNTLAGDHRVAIRARVGSARAQALQRIHRERQRLEVHLDLGDRVLCGRLVDRGDRQNRLAHVMGLVGEDGVPGCRNRRHVIGGQHGHDALHPQCFRRIDAAHPSVRHGTQEQPAEQHAVGTKIFCVLRAPRHLGPQIGWHEVLA